MSQRNVCYIVFSSRHRAQIDCTSSQTEHFHCWRQTLPLRGELFNPAAEKEIVRHDTELRSTADFDLRAPRRNRHQGSRQTVPRRSCIPVCFMAEETCGIHDTSSPSFMKRGVDIGKDLYTNVVHITC